MFYIIVVVGISHFLCFVTVASYFFCDEILNKLSNLYASLAIEALKQHWTTGQCFGQEMIAISSNQILSCACVLMYY